MRKRGGDERRPVGEASVDRRAEHDDGNGVVDADIEDEREVAAREVGVSRFRKEEMRDVRDHRVGVFHHEYRSTL